MGGGERGGGDIGFSLSRGAVTVTVTVTVTPRQLILVLGPAPYSPHLVANTMLNLTTPGPVTAMATLQLTQ